jgi:DNA polymerase (family 10)
VADLSNSAIAEAFDELADLYELDGAVVHRVLAYRTAAKNVRNATVSVAELTRQGRVTSLPGIGKTLEEKIRALIDTGTIPAAEKLRAKFPPGLIDMTRLPGLGPKRARRLFDELGIDSLEALRTAAEEHRLREVRGFGPKFEQSVLDAFAKLDVIESCSSPGENAARARTHTGMAIDLRVVEPDQFGNLWQHFTGSKDHNVQLRERAVRKGLHVSEYGLLDDASATTHRCATEEDVYALLGLPWIPPELREGRGELDLEEVPLLITQDDLRGDLHCHTTLSDGRNSLEQMARGARDRGLEYLAVTDHSATHGFGNHVTPEALRARIEEVRELNASLDGFELLVGTETNILPDGSPDYDDDLLAELDWVVGSVHTSFGMSSEEMTARIVAACEHPWIDAIGHLTGRKIETRAPYAVDTDAVFAAAARTGTMLEINSAPDRRDLNDIHARAAKQAGVRILINSDAHGVSTLGITRWGVATARRAWLTKDDVANTLPWKQFAKLRKHAASAKQPR